jgi:hypothetical protein
MGKEKFGFILIPIIVIAFWMLYPFIIASDWIQNMFPESNWNNFGVVGDSFGALNTLFSGLALSGLVINVYLQFQHIRKIEQKAEDNETKLNEQIEAIRSIALLNYYNHELNREDWKMELQKAAGGSGSIMIDTAKNIHEIRKERKALVKKIEAEKNE